MKKVLQKLLDTLLREATPIMGSLNKGVTDAEIRTFEQEMNVKLPEEVKELYKTFNGQKMKEESSVSFLNSQYFIPLEKVKKTQNEWLERLSSSVKDWQSFEFDKEEAEDFGWYKRIKNQLFNSKWIPFLADDVSYVFIDLDPDEKGKKGQVVEFILDTENVEHSFVELMNDSLKDWFKDLIEEFGNEELSYDKDIKTLTFQSECADEIMNNIFAPTPDYVSEGGSNVYSYGKENSSDFVFPDRTCVYMDEICEHFKKYIGEPESVFHEIMSEYVHIDVHWIKPTEERPYHVLFTTGMSDYPMYLPKELENPNEFSHAELMVYLPKDWKIDENSFDDDNYWPIYFLKMIARFPHQYKTWMAEGHTIPNGLEAEPIANTNFGCILLMPPYLSAPQDFLKLQTKDETTINFYCILPLYVEEMDLKLEEGVDALLDLFDEYQISEVVDIHRENVAV
ncbi:suppressor of fused domain protein [Capnocytophaga stomatis]|uniref:suppressor of fused domain protein n=1 Tax=Capnocytophaga stomatis TaxID=1848904 RepID=UPI00385E5635